MASLWVDLRDIKFQLFEVLKINETLLGKGRYKDFDADTCSMALDAAAKFAETDIAPTYPDEVHRKPVEATFDKGKVTTPESYKKLWKLYCENGYMAMADQPEVGGQGFPAVIAAAAANMFLACNQAFICIPV